MWILGFNSSDNGKWELTDFSDNEKPTIGGLPNNHAITMRITESLYGPAYAININRSIEPKAKYFQKTSSGLISLHEGFLYPFLEKSCYRCIGIHNVSDLTMKHQNQVVT